MGLDQYAFAIDKEDSIDEFSFTRKEEVTSFQYWRKNNALHKWMADLYISKGGTEEFNCVPVILTVDDLLFLQRSIVENSLTPAEGFFWGSQQYTEDDKKDDLEFVANALLYISQGKVVYYNSWW
jgi:hypothetical protein